MRSLALLIFVWLIGSCGAAVAQADDAPRNVKRQKAIIANDYVVANTLPPDAFVSLRSEPTTKTGRRITTMPNGTTLRILEQRPDGWWRVRIVSSGQEGWALSGHAGKTWIVAAAPSAAPATSVADTGRVSPKKTLKAKHDEGTMPFALDCNHNGYIKEPYAARHMWTGPLVTFNAAAFTEAVLADAAALGSTVAAAAGERVENECRSMTFAVVVRGPSMLAGRADLNPEGISAYFYVQRTPSSFQTSFQSHAFVDFLRDRAQQQAYQAQVASRAENERAAEERRMALVRSTVSRIDAENGRNVDSEDGRAFISPLLGVYQGRGLCQQFFQYAGGKVLGRSIDGNVGVVLVEIFAVAKSNTQETEIGSPVANACGHPSQPLGPGGVMRMELKGQFRKYDTGWRLESVLN